MDRACARERCLLGETCYPDQDRNVRIKWGRGVRIDAPIPPNQVLEILGQNLIVRFYTIILENF
jgi:hypothetical protein